MLKWVLSLTIAVGFVSLFAIHVVFAAGVGISPGKLEFDDSSGIKTVLHVINTGETKADYELYTEDGYKDWFQIRPNNFSLSPKEDVSVEISLSNMVTLGEHHTIISVVAFNKDNQGSRVGSGIKVPVNITLKSLIVGVVAETEYEPKTPAEEPTSGILLWPIMLGAGILLVSLVISIFVIRRRRRVGQA